MVREILRPTNEYYNLHIPKEYIGKDIEVIVLPLYNLKKSAQIDSDISSFNPKEFYGMTSVTKESIDEYLVDSKNEWKSEKY